jgi:hypothetical protein
MSAVLTGKEPHPVIPLLEPELEEQWRKIDAKKIEEYYAIRREAMMMESLDPFRNGYEPEIWKRADAQLAALRERNPVGVVEELDLGGNRAAKSERAAKRLVQLMVNKPGARVWFLQSTQTISRQSQQNIVWKYLPPEWKPQSGRTKREITTKINYTQAGGFTEDTFVLPNGSQGFFKFYSVAVSSVEGPELDAAWADELVTEDWLEFLRYRLVTRNGYLLTTFTPVEGYSSTVKGYLDNAKTIEEADAELLPIRDESGEVKALEKVPRIQESANGKAVILYFHTADNPYGNYPSMKETLRGKPRETILMRAYGVPSKTFGAALPMFRRNVHVITTEQWMGLQKKVPGSRYHLIDPCSGRNWYMCWCYCMRDGKIVIYREWPSHGHLAAYIPGIGDPGPWTISGKAFDGERGPAQTSFGFGLERYKQEILRQESGEEISERFMDARTANSPTATRDGSTTLIEQMSEMDMEFRGSTSEKKVFGDENGSIDLLNSKLYFDLETPLGEFSPQLSRINGPELLVTENCPNLIYSMENWSGRDGQHGSSKDPIDVVRMIVLNELEYVSDDMLRPKQPWMQQFAA